MIILYDLETNGTSTSMDRILEVYAQYTNGTGFHSYVQIEDNNVDLYAFHKNGWTEDFLNENGRPMKDVMVDLFRFFKKHPESMLCGYFIRTFDNLFLKKMQNRYGLPEFDWENTFDIALEYKAELSGLYSRFPRSNWRLVHEMVIRNDYSSYIKKTGFGMRTEECCRYYGVPVDSKKQHNAVYDTSICQNILKKQRPEWFN